MSGASTPDQSMNTAGQSPPLDGGILRPFLIQPSTASWECDIFMRANGGGTINWFPVHMA